MASYLGCAGLLRIEKSLPFFFRLCESNVKSLHTEHLSVQRPTCKSCFTSDYFLAFTRIHICVLNVHAVVHLLGSYVGSVHREHEQVYLMR